MVWGTFFPTLPGGVRACQGGLGHFFHVCLFDRGRGGLKLFGQCPHRTNTFQKGASLRNLGLKDKINDEIWFQRRHRHFPGRRPEIRPNGALRYFPEPSSCLSEWLHRQCDWGHWLHWRQLVIVIVMILRQLVIWIVIACANLSNS